MVWNEGTKLQSRRYEIGEVLERSGFGITYKAKHLELEEYVVIKTPDKYLKDDSEYNRYIAQFKEEAQRLANFSSDSHPHIVRVRDLFQEEETYCLVMDFIPGKNLFQLVKQRGAIPEAEIVPYIRKIGETLAFVHGKGVVHRDAHPGNIIIQPNGQPILIDFGIAKDIIPGTMSSTGKGGNKSLAPYKQIIRDNQEPNVDVYCLAATFYYAVTGKKPPTSLDRKLYNSPLTEPKAIISSISHRLNTAIIAGMELEAVTSS